MGSSSCDELPAPKDRWSRVVELIGELRDGQTRLADFTTDFLDDLDALGVQLAQREEQFDSMRLSLAEEVDLLQQRLAATEQVERENALLLSHAEQLEAELQDREAELEAERAARAGDQSLLDEEIGRRVEELTAARDAMQNALAHAETHSQRLQTDLAAVEARAQRLEAEFSALGESLFPSGSSRRGVSSTAASAPAASASSTGASSEADGAGLESQLRLIQRDVARRRVQQRTPAEADPVISGTT